MLRPTVFSILIILAAPSFAEVKLDRCAKIDTDLDRLACYDKVSGRTPTSESIESSMPTGAWDTRIEKSKFEDTTDVFLSVASTQPVNCGGFAGPEKIVLYARCQENTTSLIIATGQCHLASGFGGYGRVDFRVDDEKSYDYRMNESTNNRSLGLWRGSQAIPAIKKLLGHDTLLVRFTPFNESPVTAEFRIEGLAEAVKPLRDACSW
ncbi:type VI secretion protein [Aliiroseovarius sp. S2029]|uniref:type VI secretion system-associated protein TagO n=1 Tax=Aliiroseovarius sp. S2029 TaxID=2936988 RepID=UPI0020C036E6|nr:type VI secretion system-associated protein TagO [Aliiroseovarius sp. S2029]MCK8483275.1 type VI secretion protein [Aliiroseovarius sp. S2029]